jgi:hypothetical protein
MLRFFAARLFRAALTIAMVVTFAFIVLRLSGDPAQIIMGADAPPEAVVAFRAAWGLDDPLWQQYFRYFGAILNGDLGRSMRDGRDAIALVAERVPATLALTIPGSPHQARHRHPRRHRGRAAPELLHRPAGDGARRCRLHRALLRAWAPSGAGLRGAAGLAALGRAGELAACHPAGDHAGCRRRGRARALHALGHAGGAGPALYPHRIGQGRAHGAWWSRAMRCPMRPSRP